MGNAEKSLRVQVRYDEDGLKTGYRKADQESQGLRGSYGVRLENAVQRMEHGHGRPGAEGKHRVGLSCTRRLDQAVSKEVPAVLKKPAPGCPVRHVSFPKGINVPPTRSDCIK